MAKRERPWNERVAEERWKSIPSAKAYRGMWREGRMRSRGQAWDVFDVLVDAKAEHKKPDAELLAIMEEVPSIVWDAARQRVLGVYYADEVATRIGLPLWDRIEELNETSFWEAGRAAAASNGDDINDNDYLESKVYNDAYDAERTELFRIWCGAVEDAFDGPVSQIDHLHLRTSNGSFEFKAGSPLVVSRPDAWRKVGISMLDNNVIDMDPDDAPGPATWKEFVLYHLDVDFWTSGLFDKREARRIYQDSFER